jgi:hypothetical protein
MDLKVKAS